jgi:hypothetical protein
MRWYSSLDRKTVNVKVNKSAAALADTEPAPSFPTTTWSPVYLLARVMRV